MSKPGSPAPLTQRPVSLGPTSDTSRLGSVSHPLAAQGRAHRNHTRVQRPKLQTGILPRGIEPHQARTRLSRPHETVSQTGSPWDPMCASRASFISVRLPVRGDVNAGDMGPCSKHSWRGLDQLFLLSVAPFSPPVSSQNALIPSVLARFFAFNHILF